MSACASPDRAATNCLRKASTCLTQPHVSIVPVHTVTRHAEQERMLTHTRAHTHDASTCQPARESACEDRSNLQRCPADKLQAGHSVSLPHTCEGMKNETRKMKRECGSKRCEGGDGRALEEVLKGAHEGAGEGCRCDGVRR